MTAIEKLIGRARLGRARRYASAASSAEALPASEEDAADGSAALATNAASRAYHDALEASRRPPRRLMRLRPGESWNAFARSDR